MFDLTLIVSLAVALITGGIWLRIGGHRLARAPERGRQPDPFVAAGFILLWVVLGVLGSKLGLQLSGVEDPVTAGLRSTVPMAFGMAIAQGLVFAAFLILRKRTLPSERMSAWRAAGIGVLALFVFWPLAQVVLRGVSMYMAWRSGEPAPVIAHETLEQLQSTPWSIWSTGMLLVAVVVAPITEEIFNRGIMQGMFIKLGLSAWPAIIATSLLFAAMHATVATEAAVAGLFVMSLGFGWARERTGRLTSAIAMHAAFNAINFALAMLFVN